MLYQVEKSDRVEGPLQEGCPQVQGNESPSITGKKGSGRERVDKPNQEKADPTVFEGSSKPRPRKKAKEEQTEKVNRECRGIGAF